ncbi:hypothetical protein QA601_03415 [Chitinispirillales bacterium ANBcel5]|uniref:hypothetical protein n=1 Tax=Cellulosispirillum alkaliphilum TaxID=3039283 RepID=UPI002A57C15E|nr:hypothetical protein [Chitinispirillales bacterium ANBcel5]
MSDKNSDEFENGLREILSSGGNSSKDKRKTGKKKMKLEPNEPEKSHINKKTVIIYTIIRIIAALLVLIFFIMFVLQISFR